MRRLLLSLALLLALALPASAQITFDAASSGLAISATSVTFSHTVGAGSNVVLYVGCFSTTLTPTLTATYNGVSMGTAKWSSTETTVSSRSTGFLLVAPASGAHNVVVSASGTLDYLYCVSQSWSGVDQATPNRTPATFSEDGGNTTVSLSVSNAVSGDVIVDMLAAYSGGVTANAAQTSRGENDAIGGGDFCAGSSSKAATGATTMDWTVTADGFWTMGAMALIPSSGGGGGATRTSGLPLLGVGGRS